MTVMASGVGSTSETGIGAMIPWADRLWAVGYVAHIRGSGIGLYEIGAWHPYAHLEVPPKGYVHHEFPDGYSAHWVRVRADRACRATASFRYN